MYIKEKNGKTMIGYNIIYLQSKKKRYQTTQHVLNRIFYTYDPIISDHIKYDISVFRIKNLQF